MTGKLIVETIFCDAELNLMVQRTYFARLKRTLLSLSRITVPEDLDVVHLLYVSVDKKRWLQELETLTGRLSRTSAVSFRVIPYGHPSNGYSSGGQAHPDTVKGPNKQHPLRNHLFRSTGEDVVDRPYEYIARATLDDDDLWLPWQAQEIRRVCMNLVSEPADQVVGVGLRNNFIAYSDEGGVKAQSVAMNRMLTGNKFYFYPPTAFDQIGTLSPWNVPELMTVNYRERYRRTGVDLRIQEHNVPGFVYMRRGNNLSAQQKTGYVTTEHGAADFADEAAMYESLAADRVSGMMPPRPMEIDYGIDPAQYRISVRRQANGDVSFSTNVQEVFGGESRFAFHLLRGVEPVQKLGYGARTSGVFRDAPANCRVKIYVRAEDGRRESKVSNVV
ncbi:hypothetical protein GCM10011374_29480 [Kocuria dechangensis]|uniref:Uncharacterized protein n=1 Tax=Kocuria dechangensis TaxID=1176249 RepID=A0A917H0Z6_9MICC|nr:hypothetical protein [Kocuria dechangensis]GGG64045.1 hypothetical protein GCM10011374_29480 [Kocuria dechangensis]